MDSTYARHRTAEHSTACSSQFTAVTDEAKVYDWTTVGSCSCDEEIGPIQLDIQVRVKVRWQTHLTGFVLAADRGLVAERTGPTTHQKLKDTKDLSQY